MNRVKAWVLAAGLGTRLRPLTDTTPKCLVTIGGQPLLHYWIEALHKAGVERCLINTHHLPEPVNDYLESVRKSGRLDISAVYEPVLLGSAGTIAHNADFVSEDERCLIIYADNLSNVDLEKLLAFDASHDDPFTMLLFRTRHPERCGIATLDDEGRIVEFVEKPKEPKSSLANAGVYVVSGAAYREIAEMKAFDLGFDVLPRFAGRMRGFLHGGYHVDIGTLEALEEARADFAQHFPPTSSDGSTR
jgi:mannose-1-phosphate guanylyltransferase